MVEAAALGAASASTPAELRACGIAQRSGRGELGVAAASARCRVSVWDAVELPELPEEPDGDGDLAAAVGRSPLAAGAVSSGVLGTC